MLDEAGLKMMELAGKGYCCSQILVLLALEEMDRENPDLVRAAAGLCNGLGDCSGPCGVLTGANLLLGMHAGTGTAMGEGDDLLPVLLEAMREWFVAATTAYGGTACGDILDGECGQPNPARCGGLLTDAFEQVRTILADNGLDPSEGRDLS